MKKALMNDRNRIQKKNKIVKTMQKKNPTKKKKDQRNCRKAVNDE